MSPLTRTTLIVLLTSACTRIDAPATPPQPLSAPPGPSSFGPAAQSSFDLSALDIAPLRELQAAHRPAAAYWRDDAGAHAARSRKILSAERAARTAVLAAFGPAAVDTPVFAPLFKPLHDRMPELSADQQMRISDLERRFTAARFTGSSTTDFDELLDDIRTELGESVAGEYALRHSPLSGELRSAELDLDEGEFRRVFAPATALANAADAATFVATRRTLREQLGAARFVRFWSRRDPAFGNLQATAARLGLAEDTVMSAYALLVDSQDAMIASAGAATYGTGTLAADRQQALRSLYDETRRRLTDITGVEAADALLVAFTGASDSPPSGARRPER